MTKEEMIRAYAMRLDGESWEEIGKALKYAGVSVYCTLLASIQSKPRQGTVIYPVLRELIETKYHGRINEFVRDLEMPESTTRNILKGISQPSRQFLTALEGKTGLSADQAFQTPERT